AFATDLDPSEAAEIVSKLNAEGIKTKMNFSGSSVLVPKQQWSQARLVAGDRLGSSFTDSSEMDNSFLADPSMNHFRILRRREDALARSIMRMDSVSNATVHIARPEPTPFIKEQSPTTASVVLELRTGAVVTQEQSAAVVAMVAGSIEGLLPDNVTVMDSRGRILSGKYLSANSDIASQFEFRRKLEADLATKSQAMLSEMLGTGQAIVRVTADIDFTRKERMETFYDPDGKVKTSERITSKSKSGGDTTGAGAAGTAANLAGRGGARQAVPISEKEEENDTEYENAKTVNTVTEAGGTIKRLTIAAMVDLSGDTEQQGKANVVTQEQVEGLIKQAVGFDTQRGDSIEVVSTSFAASGPADGEDPYEAEKWNNYTALARNSSLGLAAVVALILGLLILKKLRPISLPRGDREATISIDRTRVLTALSAQARDNPEVVSSILAAWLEDSREATSNRGNENRQAVKAAA
ncbi:MAG: flagellar basal-body MS-ring/collar protein FliF, partial [Pirellulales bacterium]